MGMSCENEEKYWRKWEKNCLERDDMMKNFFSSYIDGKMNCISYLEKKNNIKKKYMYWFLVGSFIQ